MPPRSTRSAPCAAGATSRSASSWRATRGPGCRWAGHRAGAEITAATARGPRPTRRCSPVSRGASSTDASGRPDDPARRRPGADGDGRSADVAGADRHPAVTGARRGANRGLAVGRRRQRQDRPVIDEGVLQPADRDVLHRDRHRVTRLERPGCRSGQGQDDHLTRRLAHHHQLQLHQQGRPGDMGGRHGDRTAQVADLRAHRRERAVRGSRTGCADGRLQPSVRVRSGRG